MKSRSRSRSRLFIDTVFKEKKYKVKLGYANSEKAYTTIKNVKKFPLSIQKQLIQSMLNRATYNKNQTQGMRDAIKIYKKWLYSVA